MANPPETFEQRLWELLATRDAADAAGERHDRVTQVTIKALGQIARDQFPGMGQWEPERLRQLADSIALYAKLFAGDLDKFNSDQ